MDASADYEDRLYHGFFDRKRERRNRTGDGYEEVPRILVEKPAGGPTERQLNLVVLYELVPLDAELHGGFHWGYHGSGPSRVAAAVLADALELGDPELAGMGYWRQDQVRGELCQAFVVDAVSELCDEWRMRRTLVMRWARAWYLQHYPVHLPPCLHHIPNVTRYGPDART